MSQFNYCPLIWMFPSQGPNNKVYCLHERCLCTVYSDNSSSIEDLLDKNESVLIFVKNVQTFALEMFKVAKNLSAPIVSEILKIKVMFMTWKIHLKLFYLSFTMFFMV